MLSAMFPNVPIVALTVTATEKTRNIIANSLWMVDPDIIAVNPNRKNIFYPAARCQHAGDDEIEAPLLSYIAKLKGLIEKMPLLYFIPT